MPAAQQQRDEVEMAWDRVEGNGHDCNQSVAAEGHVLMTPGGQGPRARVGQGPRTPKVEPRVLPIASGQVKVGGGAQ